MGIRLLCPDQLLKLQLESPQGAQERLDTLPPLTAPCDWQHESYHSLNEVFADDTRTLSHCVLIMA